MKSFIVAPDKSCAEKSNNDSSDKRPIIQRLSADYTFLHPCTKPANYHILVPIQWMEDVRDIVNYREVSFEEPECLDIWSKYKEPLDTNSLSDLLEQLINASQYIYCFKKNML